MDKKSAKKLYIENNKDNKVAIILTKLGVITFKSCKDEIPQHNTIMYKISAINPLTYLYILVLATIHICSAILSAILDVASAIRSDVALYEKRNYRIKEVK